MSVPDGPKDSDGPYLNLDPKTCFSSLRHLVGFLQLLRCANQKPAKECTVCGSAPPTLGPEVQTSDPTHPPWSLTAFHPSFHPNHPQTFPNDPLSGRMLCLLAARLGLPGTSSLEAFGINKKRSPSSSISNQNGSTLGSPSPPGCSVWSARASKRLSDGEERRFGELMLRGPRVPESHFVLGGLDKCDAQARLQSSSGGPGDLR